MRCVELSAEAGLPSYFIYATECIGPVQRNNSTQFTISFVYITLGIRIYCNGHRPHFLVPGVSEFVYQTEIRGRIAYRTVAK